MSNQTTPPKGNATQETQGLMRALASVMNDRQPDAQKQTPETEWRRQRDLFVSIKTLRDILSALIRKMQDGSLSPLDQKGQVYTNDGNGDVPLDPPTGSPSHAILTTDPTTKTGLRWDSDLWSQVQQCCGGSTGKVDYGLITEPVTVNEDYGGVADPPLSSYDWGGLD